MHYNFLADEKDKLAILEFIFNDTDLKIYDTASDLGQEVCEYKNIQDISSKFDLSLGGKSELTFQLWSPRHKGQPIFNKVALNPKYCEGHTFRYNTNGWGLIQLYFGGIKNNELSQSHLGHFNEKGALNREDITSINGKVADWDWKEIQITSRKLKYQIHNKLAVRKIGSLGVLDAADKLERSGIVFR